MTVLMRFREKIRAAAIYNTEAQVAPACILWPDCDRQWEAIIPRLLDELPELIVLGEYRPAARTGPAIWIRCALAGLVEEVVLPEGQTPIIYLPGVSRQDLRNTRDYPDYVKPLVELQYRGAIWSQVNGKDWTILAFLKSKQGGLGLNVAQDRATLISMQSALPNLLEEEINHLSGKLLDREFFHTLLTSGDPIRELLKWLNLEDGFRQVLTDDQWTAFVELTKSKFVFDPVNEGILSGVERLIKGEGTWMPVWERYCEAPHRYPNIPNRMRQLQMPQDGLLFSNAHSHGNWPQWNDEQEMRLREELSSLVDLSSHEARQKLPELEKQHGERRTLVWSELGEAPLANAMEYLDVLARITATGLTAGEIDDIQTGYMSSGWQADEAVLRALSVVRQEDDIHAVGIAIRAIYLPWLEDSARYLQKQVEIEGYPGGAQYNKIERTPPEGECILFVDGLRYDLAKYLNDALANQGYMVNARPVWAPLPSVTATGKPAVSPVSYQITGAEDCTHDFEPIVAETSKSLRGGYQLKKLMHEAGWVVLNDSDSLFPPVGRGAWYEYGDIDSEGHQRGVKLVYELDRSIMEIADRVKTLISAGWTRVRIVTDHGWLLMPGGLPKKGLPKSLTESKWGRCAVMKPGAVTDENLYAWYWNANQQFALANGVSCYKKGEEYSHGGLSLQECLTLELTVSASSSLSGVVVEITDVVWTGLRCKVALGGDFMGLMVDIRKQPGDPTSSLALNTKEVKETGIASIVVEDDDLEGVKAMLVVLNAEGHVVAQQSTVIGGEK